MNPIFQQPGGSVSKETNKETIARIFGCKKSEIVYAKIGILLDGYKVIYDKVAQRAYALPANIAAGSTIISINNGILTYSGGTLDLGSLAALRGEYVKLTQDFSTGFTINVRNEVVLEGGVTYRWGGDIPKTVAAGKSVAETGGISTTAWCPVDDNKSEFRKQFNQSFERGGTATAGKTALLYEAEGLYYTPLSGTIAVNPGSTPNSSWICVGLQNGYPTYDARNWGLVGDDATDNTAAWLKLIAKTSGQYRKITFPAGVFRYTDLGSIKINRSTWEGAGSLTTTFRCMSTVTDHTAFKIDAWPDANDPNQPFIDAFNMKGIHIEGNSKTLVVLDMQGISRCIWDDVSTWGANSTNGTGIFLRASSLNNFNNLMCSRYHNLAGQSVNVPKQGMVITTGYRAGAFQGSPSNNLFTNLYMEGVTAGLNIIYGDQNTFIGGSCEANSDYGTTIGTGCRYNTFINMGNENLNATTGDFIDKGRYTKFINCYSSHRMVLLGVSATIDGGFFERIEIQSNGVSNTVINCNVNHWNSGAGGFFDSGIGTIKYNIYDSDIPDYINTTDTRHAITLTTSAVSGGTVGYWDNATRLPVTVFIQGTATITAARILRGGAGGDAVSIPTSSVQQVHLESKDRIEVTYSSSGPAPSLSYRAKNGYN